MALLRGHRISVPAYCYPRYDYLSDRAATLRKYFKRIEGSANFHRCLSEGEEKLDSIIRNGMTLKKKLDLFVFYKNEDSDFLKINQFLVKDVDEEDKTEPVDSSWEEFLAFPKNTKDVDLSTVLIIVLPGKPSEMLKEVEDSNIFTALPKRHTYFVSKDTKECCKMEDISNLDQWTSNLSHLVQSGLENTVMDVVKQMEQFMAEFIPGMGAPKQGNILDFLREHLDGWYENEHALQDLSPVTQSQGGKGTSKTSEGELTITFRQKMQDFLSRKTKCLVLDFIAKDKGVKPSVMNHYLLNNLDFENALQKAITLKSMPSYTDLRKMYKKAFQKYFKDCMSAISPLINSVESLVTNLMVILEKMRRLQFVTHALLRQSPLTCKDIKEPPTLPEELQQDLLKELFVTGCGTIFGELAIHVKSAISDKEKECIEELLQLHGYYFPHKVEVFVPLCKKTAKGSTVMQGACIRTKKREGTQNDMYGYSSLGCFVDVKSHGQKNIHFVTCYHCIENCEEIVSVMPAGGADYVDGFGELRHPHEDVDIALLEVMTPYLQEISKHLIYSDDNNKIRELDRWQFCREEIVAGRMVYKFGYKSNITRGFIASHDYRQSYNINLSRLPPNVLLICPLSELSVSQNSMLVDASGEPAQQGVPEKRDQIFSEAGDSGSVVFDTEPSTGYGQVMGLLQGAMSDGDVCKFSYASNLIKALSKVQERYSEIESIEPSLDQNQFPDLPGAAAY